MIAKSAVTDENQWRLTLLERQEERIQGKMEKLNALSNRCKMMEMMIFVGGILLFITTVAVSRLLGIAIVPIAMVSFYMALKTHRKADQSYVKYNVWQRLVRTQIARIQLDWNALPPVATRDSQEMHPFDADLDISGERSIHRLMNTAVSFEGIQRLRDWLLTRVPDLDAIRQRQVLVRELIPLTRFRDKLMLNSLFTTRLSDEPLDAERIVEWLDEHAASTQRLSTLLVAIALSSLTLLLLALYLFAHISPLFCIASLILSLIWFLITKREQGGLATDADYLSVVFSQLNTIFEYLEKYPYAPRSQLKMLCEPFFLHGDRRPSILLRRLSRIASRTALAKNPETWLIINAIIPIGAFTAYQLDRCKEQVAQYLPAWLDAWYELEALSSLANFAYLNPEYMMPEVVSGEKRDQAVLFQVKDLGHPLIEKEKKVTNDFSMDESNEIVMVTGSNMAGKSTFLRSMGLNLCLAYAGSVVNATFMRAPLYELYACIRVTDSVTDGYSYFYAEVRRLKGLLNELEQGPRYPLFFLIDEIFKGTNNVERLIGSEAYIRALVGKNCTGAVSTHDLELVKLADAFTQIKNYHFRESIVGDQMVFEYILRPGPSPTRNALKIMQMEGLPVQWDASLRPAGS